MSVRSIIGLGLWQRLNEMGRLRRTCHVPGTERALSKYFPLGSDRNETCTGLSWLPRCWLLAPPAQGPTVPDGVTAPWPPGGQRSPGL